MTQYKNFSKVFREVAMGLITDQIQKSPSYTVPFKVSDLWPRVDLLKGDVLVEFIEWEQLIGSFSLAGSLKNRERTQLWFMYQIRRYFQIWKILWNLTVMQCRSWIPDCGVSSGSFQYRDKWKPWHVLNPAQCRWSQCVSKETTTFLFFFK